MSNHILGKRTENKPTFAVNDLHLLQTISQKTRILF